MPVWAMALHQPLAHQACGPVCAGVAGQLDKQVLEGAACTAALALSCVLAGSGDLSALKLLRGAHVRRVMQDV